LRKIIHIITRLDMGGSAQNTLRSCIGLSGNKYQIVLVHGLSHESIMTADERRVVSKDVEIAEQKGVRVLPLASLIKRIEPVQDSLAFISLLKLMVQEKPDAVHTHSSKAGLLGRWAAWLARVPVIFHTPHGHVFYGHFPNSVSKLFLLIEKISDTITDCTIALTYGERKDYIKLSVSRDAKLTTIHSGVDVETFMNPVIDLKAKRKVLNIEPDARVIGTVGWLMPIKGPVYLLKSMPQVWQKNPDVKLVFVGKGELESELKAVADDMGARDRVLFLGWRDDVHEVMSVFDIFLLPSLNEGMGRVIVEAMAAG
jgi:glycosyltransferase involved in cell wall biosynthesis